MQVVIMTTEILRNIMYRIAEENSIERDPVRLGPLCLCFCLSFIGSRDNINRVRAMGNKTKVCLSIQGLSEI